MQYDFSRMCCDQLEAFRKRIDTSNKKWVKQYFSALDVINDPVTQSFRTEIELAVNDMLNDAANRCECLMTEALNKVQLRLTQHFLK